MELLKVNGKMDTKSLAKHVLVPIIGGSVTGWLANRHAQEKYKKLKKPSFSPPSAVFPIAWTTLYGLMGLAKYRVSKQQEGKRKKEISIYELQLGLNFLWSFLFFRWELRGTALVEMTVLLGAIALTAYDFFQVDRTAGTLMIPYIGWVIFALSLNYATWKLNE
ncbi:tryptophan-rich sensory protein [Rummeliibacillus sp. G93]|uniref:TspO/MBR family protein n=1 Tax=Rummeliibacillus sp. G93 TaxID=2939494 RepID=UPI00201C447F|nr:TspO/MBR family protein [Rummeliibacillus sp. G93]UQW97950.1 tryptophan-rich sensory protein [Rummeliibacillus sp. G93]